MGSVTDFLECPRCGSEAHTEFWYKSGEEAIICRECGYTRTSLITNWDEQGTDGWIPKFSFEEVEGCGGYKVQMKGAIGFECGAFTVPEGVEEFKRLVEERKDEVEWAEYTTFKDGVLDKFSIIEKPKQETNE